MALVDDNTLRRCRATFSQLEAMWEFLECNRELATGFNKSAQAREHSKRLWISIAETLNSEGVGSIKDWKGWSNYWVDYKTKLKRSAASIRASQNRTGGGPSFIPPLNDIEKTLMGLLGSDFGAGLPNIQINPFPILPHSSASNTSNITPPLPVLAPTIPPTSPTIILPIPSSPPQMPVVKGDVPVTS